MNEREKYPLDKFFNKKPFRAAYNEELWRNSELSFLAYYKKLFRKYMRMLEQSWPIPLPGDTTDGSQFNEVLSHSKKNARTVGKGIIKALTHCLEGRRHEGFAAFSECLPEIGSFEPMIDKSYNEHRYFRIRLTDNVAEIGTVSDMFHIPFSKRHNIREYRYSILGYPCLYLASSLYTCWEEMGRPPFHTVVLSRFQPTDSFNRTKILFLSIAPRQYKEEIARRARVAEHTGKHIEIESLKTFFEFWPLQLACSIPTKYPKGVFHEEYIIPQFLMEWIRCYRKVNGVCYRTTKVPQMDWEQMHPYLLYNYAFPARQIASDHCSELSRDFLLTPPIPFELSLTCDRQELKHGDFSGFFNPASPIPFTLPTGISTPSYQKTGFGNAEYRSACDTAIALGERTDEIGRWMPHTMAVVAEK